MPHEFRYIYRTNLHLRTINQRLTEKGFSVEDFYPAETIGADLVYKRGRNCLTLRSYGGGKYWMDASAPILAQLKKSLKLGQAKLRDLGLVLY